MIWGGINSRPYEQQQSIAHRAGDSDLQRRFFNSALKPPLIKKVLQLLTLKMREQWAAFFLDFLKQRV
jgi:hypothetical protein